MCSTCALVKANYVLFAFDLRTDLRDPSTLPLQFRHSCVRERMGNSFCRSNKNIKSTMKTTAALLALAASADAFTSSKPAAPRATALQAGMDDMVGSVNLFGKPFAFDPVSARAPHGSSPIHLMGKKKLTPFAFYSSSSLRLTNHSCPGSVSANFAMDALP